jgi:hypothetical protein
VEIKNKKLTEDDARSILRHTLGKTEQINELSKMDIKTGIIARTIEGREALEKDGFLVWELNDIFL